MEGKMKQFKKVICLSIILSMLCSSSVYAKETKNEQFSENASDIVIVEHDLITGETEKKVYQDNKNLTDASMFLEPNVSLPSALSTSKSRTIIGEDDLQPADEPIPQIGRLSITGSNGSVYVGTGFLVSDNLVLTAGHCLINKDMGKAVSIKFKAGLMFDGSYLASANATRCYLPSPWEDSFDSNWDWALLRLDKPLGSSLGYFNLKVASNPVGMSIDIPGYPAKYDTNGTGVLNNQTLVYGWGNVTDCTAYRLLYTADTMGGMSGSPIMSFIGGDYCAYGIHTNGFVENQTPRNSGVRISTSIITVLNNSR